MDGPLPVWATVLVAAEDWGCTPWALAGGSPLQWFMRWQEYKGKIYEKLQKETDEWRTSLKSS